MRRFSFELAPLAILMIVPLLVLAGCEGDRGPTGPPGPPGPGVEETQYTYLGNKGAQCIHCHATKVANVLLTGHTEAYEVLEEEDRSNLYCVKCHTTGFDSEVAFGDTTITEYGPNTDGYDDYVGVDTEEAAERRAALEGVQCESCHGPMGPDFNAHKPRLSFATHTDPTTGESLSLCYPCHETQLEEWVESGHGTVQQGSIDDFNAEHYAQSSSCRPCHTAEGFVQANDPNYFDRAFEAPYNFIGCPTCHDPHSIEMVPDGHIHQLRTTDPVEVAFHPGLEPGDPEVPRMEGYGPGQLCAHCHHGRRDTDNVLGQIENGYAYFGPHESPQMDMFIGAGCYEIEGYTYDGEHIHQTSVEEACVKCHMVREVELHGELQDHSFHTFEPDVGNCEPCHEGLPDFDYNGVQTAVQEKMDELAGLFGYADADDMIENWDSQAEGVEPWQREAAYALFFVHADGSRGVHNPTYAFSLLENAIEHYNSQPKMAKLTP